MKAVTWTGVLLALVFLMTICTATATAQQTQLFGGRGIASEEEQPVESKPGMHWPKLLDFSTDKPTDEEQFRLFGPKRDSFFKSDAAPETETRSSMFDGFPSLLPKRDPSEPTLFQRMNQRSKDFVDRTTNWAQEKNQNLRTRSSETWETMTRNLRPDSSARDADGVDSRYGATPQFRRAENLDEQPSVRF